MSNEKLARQWAERKKALAKRHMEDAGYFPREDTLAAIEHVLATTTPLTMADVVWDWEKHYLAGATNEIGDVECVMIAPMDGMIVNAEFGDGRLVRTSPGALTPNGRRYELREVGAGEPDVRRARALVEELARDHNLHSLTDGKLARLMNEVLDALATITPVEDTDEPEHTATLITEDDYASAPEGTIVDVNDCVARRGMYGWRISGARSRFTSYEMAQLGEGDVIRWGGWDK